MICPFKWARKPTYNSNNICIKVAHSNFELPFKPMLNSLSLRVCIDITGIKLELVKGTCLNINSLLNS